MATHVNGISGFGSLMIDEKTLTAMKLASAINQALNAWAKTVGMVVPVAGTNLKTIYYSTEGEGVYQQAAQYLSNLCYTFQKAALGKNAFSAPFGALIGKSLNIAPVSSDNVVAGVKSFVGSKSSPGYIEQYCGAWSADLQDGGYRRQQVNSAMPNSYFVLQGILAMNDVYEALVENKTMNYPGSYYDTLWGYAEPAAKELGKSLDASEVTAAQTQAKSLNISANAVRKALDQKLAVAGAGTAFKQATQSKQSSNGSGQGGTGVETKTTQDTSPNAPYIAPDISMDETVVQESSFPLIPVLLGGGVLLAGAAYYFLGGKKGPKEG
jgi:hypothetical protein